MEKRLRRQYTYRVTEIAISLELILGIVGSVTGVMGATSLIIHILRYLKEKPKIEAELVDAKHYYSRRGENEKNYFLNLISETRVRNKGNRGTTIGKAVLNFVLGEEKHRMTQDTNDRVGPNDMVKICPRLDFLSSYDKAPKQEEIPFQLIFYHAHGRIVLEGTSKITS